MEHYKNLTLLHSNDMHGDFFSEEEGEKVIGGISMLSGYITKTRKENKPTLYCIAGDMLQGSRIDSEYQGISTIDIMNMLAPNVVCIGNHEVDYGLAHLLFLERCAKFPIINANLFIKNTFRRLFTPYKIVKIDGMKIMFIGIITEDVIASIKRENLLGNFVEIYDAAGEVGHVCNAFRTTDIDLTVLLTHIGFEEDKKLASMLDPAWGVDIIIGGHSHTILERLEKINDILIVQAGTGTTQIGRFDMVIDTERNDIHSYTWQLIPVDSEHCPRDLKLEKIVSDYKSTIDGKYNRVLCRLPGKFSHPSRTQETEIGNLFADILKERLGVNIMLMASGSIRKETIGPIFTYGDLIELFPSDEKIYQLHVTGMQIKRMFQYVFREEMFNGEHTEFYQVSEGLKIVFDRKSQHFVKFDYEGEPIDEEQIFTVGLLQYHYVNFIRGFGFPLDTVLETGKSQIISTSLYDVLQEYFAENTPNNIAFEGRLFIRCE